MPSMAVTTLATTQKPSFSFRHHNSSRYHHCTVKCTRVLKFRLALFCTFLNSTLPPMSPFSSWRQGVWGVIGFLLDLEDGCGVDN